MSKDLTTTQAAARLGVGSSTVNLWCRRGLFANAYTREEARGAVWYIPESDLENFEPPRMGRPPKPKPEAEAKPKPKRGRKAA